MSISERNQNHDTKKEQALSISFWQYDCIVFLCLQVEMGSWRLFKVVMCGLDIMKKN